MKKFIMIASALTLPVILTTAMLSSGLAKASVAQALAQANRLPIPAGSNLPKGMKLASPSGNHLLVVGNDGNMMVVTRNGTGYVWGLDQVIDFTKVRPERVELRADGSLGAYNAQGAALWIAPARRDPSARLNVTDDGVLQLVTPNEILWASRGAVGLLKLPFKAGTLLQKGMKLASPSGNHLLVVGNDGNMMVTDKGGKSYVWGTDQVIRNFGQAGVDRVELRADGSLGSYNDKGVAIWKAPVARLDPQATLNLTNEGVLQLVTATDILWASSGPVGPLMKEATRLPLTAGFVLKKGMKYPSPSGNFNLLLASDGNLIVTTKGGSGIWSMDTVIPNFNQARPDRVEIKPDGSFASYNDKGAAVWSPALTRRDPAAKLNLTDDGDLQLVAGNGEILWAHNGILLPRIKVFTKQVALKPCTEAGWDRCVELADPKIRIMSTAGTSSSAVQAVANIYTTMLDLLLPTVSVPNPKSKFDGFKVYITNNEPWSVQSKLPVVGTMWPNQTGPMSGNALQGGASGNFLWISEQLIAKVKTRPDGGAPDPLYRTFDQVVHEMAHSIDGQLVDDRVVNQFTGNETPVESFPGRVQNWFAVPAGPIPPTEEALLKKIFRSRAAFSIEGYRP
ncbi:hypothetical protein [Armatimonas sp.]|uniref:hypothetical protein n=1 Tax=Armatimonas sp. TaxID=1872638 RepID=UPI00374CBF77